MRYIVIIITLLFFSNCSQTGDGSLEQAINERTSEFSVMEDDRGPVIATIGESGNGVKNDIDVDTLRQSIPEYLDSARQYSVSWKGLPVGKFYSEIKPFRTEAPDHAIYSDTYRAQVVMKTTGLASLALKFRNHLITTIDHVSKKPTYIPRSFRRYGTNKGKERTVMIDYNDSGTITQESVTPPDKRAKRPEVPERIKATATDPLTAILRARDKIAHIVTHGKEGDKTAIRIYTARQAMDVAITIEEFRTEDGFVRISGREVPLGGYSAKELKKHKERDTDIFMLLDPETFMPVEVYAESIFGPAKISFDRTCPTIKRCLEGS